jgi:hypothetical protein
MSLKTAALTLTCWSQKSPAVFELPLAAVYLLGLSTPPSHPPPSRDNVCAAANKAEHLKPSRLPLRSVDMSGTNIRQQTGISENRIWFLIKTKVIHGSKIL